MAAVDGASGGRSLAAWAVIDPPGQLDPTPRSTACCAAGCHHLVPRVIHQIGSLPLTANRKVDREVLARSRPDPTPVRDAAAGEPDDAIVGELSRILAKILELPEVGPDDDFFQEGGDSVAAIQ